MLDQKDYFGSVLMGLGGTEPVAVRETQWGYVVRSINPGGAWQLVIDRIARFGTFSVWVAVIGIWLAPLSMAPDMAFVAKAFVSAGVLALTYLLVSFTKRLSGYEFQVDTNRRELRTAVLNARGQSWIRASYRFDEIKDTVLQRSRLDDSARSLCLRCKGVAEMVPVAVGNEATLLAVHDRLMRDLRPIEERRSFPLLGPDEIAA